MFTFSVFIIKTNKLTNQKITKVFDRHSFSILIYKLYFTSRRFPCDHVIRSIPLSNVNEKVAMLEEQGGIEADLESFYKKLFLIQDLYASGYRMADVGPDENGLVRNYSSMIEFPKNLKILSFFSQIQDFTHSLLATAKLASFHAVSYCMRKEQKADFLIRYPFLNEDPVYRPATRDLFMQAQNSLSKKVHNIFMQQNEVNCLSHYLFGFIKRKILAKLL